MENDDNKVDNLENSFLIYNHESQTLKGFDYFIAWIKNFPITALCIFISIVLYILVSYSTYFEFKSYPQENAREYLAYIKYGAVLGGPSQELLSQGQLWRLLVNVFHHGGFIHIFFNLTAMYVIGAYAEKYMGSIAYLIFILLCGMGQEIACQLTIEQGAIGISGVAFGIFGILMIIKNQDANIKKFMTKELIRSMIFQLILFMFLTYFNILNIANVGHIFGLFYGFFFAFTFYKSPSLIKKIFFVLVNLSIIPGLYYIYNNVIN
ncbi:MAG: rhomboid family intramembrane serine protease [Candidatus Sericytochromatia bacterium]|nr:rhomboid family intramembrane serine protease [Candidatus Sericytochromatia bacterium]